MAQTTSIPRSTSEISLTSLAFSLLVSPFSSKISSEIEAKLRDFGFLPSGEVTPYQGEGPTVLDKCGFFDQLTVNDYTPGQGIPPHVDTHSPFEEVFVALSLLSGVSMNFRTADGAQTDVYLRPRQLVLFSGEARYNYLHSIATRKLDKVDGLLRFRHRRISLTFRKLRLGGLPCTCRYPRLCDSQSQQQVSTLQNSIAGNESEEAKVAPENLTA